MELNFDLKERSKELFLQFLLLLLVFHYLYPQALGVFGSSFIFLSGIVGIGLYTFHRFPFKEVVYIAIAYSVMYFLLFSSEFLNMNPEPMFFSYTRTQLAWLFSAYLIIFLIFKIHKNPTTTTIAGYILSAVLLQCILTVLMASNESIEEFLFSLETQVDVTQKMKDMSEYRLIGHGVAFFGAGVAAGLGLICCTFYILKHNFSPSKTVLFTAIYVFIFYIGLFSARTVVVGAAISLGLFIIFSIINYKTNKRTLYTFIFSAIIIFIIGYSLCLIYFPNKADWALELFTNYFEKGKLRTSSSDALEYMFILPEDFNTLLYGRGSLAFFGNDIGYIRMIHYGGIIGTVAFYLFGLVVIFLSWSKDKMTNILLIMIYIYVLLINIKGLTELNSTFYLFFFFFMFHKYYKFRPRVRVQKMKFARDKINKQIEE